MTVLDEPFSAQIAGSYAKPAWLIGDNQVKRLRRFDPASYWLPQSDVLERAQQDAARLAIYEQERAGMSVVTDGEVFRHTYDTSFLLRMTGIDFEHRAARALPSSDDAIPLVRVPYGAEEAAEATTAPQVVGPVEFVDHRTINEVTFAKSVTTTPVKVTVVGPFTAAQSVVDKFYGSQRELVLAFARTLNTELLALQASGADVLQIDEPSAHRMFSDAQNVLVEALDVAMSGVTVPVIVHVCYGYPNYIESVELSPRYADTIRLVAESRATAISMAYTFPEHQPDILKLVGDKHALVGMVNLKDPAIESEAYIERRLRAAADVLAPEKLHPSVDCGMWFLSREVAFAKLSRIGTIAAKLRNEL